MTDLIGAWELRSYHDLDDSDTKSTGPLGDSPSGLLIYESGGRMSVSMMRTDTATAPAAVPFMGYAGTWRLRDGEVVHAISVCSNPAWAGTEQIRRLTLDGDDLTLIGAAQVDGRTQRRILAWRRIIHPS